jgi:hypothetical protein
MTALSSPKIRLITYSGRGKKAGLYKAPAKALTKS